MTRANADGGGKPDAAITRGRDYDETPLIVTWEVTQACSLACDHCRADAVEQRHPDELSTAEGKRLIDQVAAFDPAPVLVFSGGDPLERPDLFDLLDYATERVPTAVTPAPTAALDRETVTRFADLGVRRMALSLDGATPARHDGFRGESGSFAAVQQAAAWAADVDLDVQVNTTVTATTAPELSAIADRVAELGAVMWEVFFLVPTGRGATLKGLDPARAESVLQWLHRHAREAPYRVITVEAPHYRRIAAAERDGPARVGSTRAGRGFVFVSHTGEVYPSGFLPVAAGDVRETPLPEVYREADLLCALRDADGFDGPCGRCPHRRQCGGSRSRAYAVTGDPLASDPLCEWVAEGIPRAAESD
ncbi:radical SAM protein [Halosegnis sp.]|uniref:radical SAM protein n=1 Tax=Halosegnis sp. TaxID=2864959 RepID=UPI0035D44CB7